MMVRRWRTIGHRDDAEFIAAVLQDATVDERSRRYAAFGLGRIGGDRAVQYLAEAALLRTSGASRFNRHCIGEHGFARRRADRRSARTATIVARNAMCGALRTLTHRPGAAEP